MNAGQCELCSCAALQACKQCNQDCGLHGTHGSFVSHKVTHRLWHAVSPVQDMGFHCQLRTSALVLCNAAVHCRYWSFVQKRRWSGYKKGATPSASAQEPSGFQRGVPPHKTPEHQATLQSQLAGLRHRAAIRAKRQRTTAAAQATGPLHDQEQDSGLEYDSSQMGDGCNMASGVTDWQAAEEQYAAQAAKKRFSATESHREQVMQQMAGLHRRASMN